MYKGSEDIISATVSSENQMKIAAQFKSRFDYNEEMIALNTSTHKPVTVRFFFVCTQTVFLLCNVGSIG